MRIKGWKQILSFTYLQTLKSKAFKAGTIIICVLIVLVCAAINILPAVFSDSDGGIFGDDGEQTETQNVNTLYVYTENELNFQLSPIQNTAFENITEEQLETKLNEITSGDKAEMLLTVTGGGDKNYSLNFYRPENEEILSRYTAEEFSYEVTDNFTKALYLSLGVSEEDIPLAMADVNSSVTVYGGESEIQMVVGQVLPMAVSLIFYMFIMLYSQSIAQSIATEKSSRVIELLITSCRPLAIIVGKIAGTLLICITQTAIFGVVGAAAFMLTAPFGVMNAVNSGAVGEIAEAAGEAAANTDIMGEISTAVPGLFDPLSIFAIIITVIMGFLFFALLAGLVGAGVSRLEDLANALQPLVLVAVAGFMLSYIPPAMNFDGGMDGVITFSYFFPISSPFALPSAILMGKIDGLQTLLAIVFLALMVFLAALLTAKVYEIIILHTGNTLKLTHMIKLARKHG